MDDSASFGPELIEDIQKATDDILTLKARLNEVQMLPACSCLTRTHIYPCSFTRWIIYSPVRAMDSVFSLLVAWFMYGRSLTNQICPNGPTSSNFPSRPHFIFSPVS